MLIADTHSDTLFEMGVKHTPAEGLAITPERLREGGVTLQTFALWTGREGNRGDVAGIVAAEMDALPRLKAAGLRQVDDPAEAKEGEQCFMLSFEGCEMFDEDIAQVALWREKGVRMAALTWNNDNRIAHAAKSGSTEGLTDYGVRVVREMQRVGMAVDVSHLNEAGFYDIFAKTDVPPLASHSCCRALCDHSRNLTDDQLRLLIREGGYVGINFYPWFLSPDGQADCALIARHIDHICQMGGEKAVGLGSDFDGIECTPSDLRHPGEIGHLMDALRALGYPQSAMEAIAGGNLVAYYARMK